jgi:hypothetical protein
MFYKWIVPNLQVYTLIPPKVTEKYIQLLDILAIERKNLHVL